MVRFFEEVDVASVINVAYIDADTRRAVVQKECEVRDVTPAPPCSRFVVMFVTNNGYMHFTTNYLLRMRELGITWTPLVACLDDECYTTLAREFAWCLPFRVPDIDGATHSTWETWGCQDYRNIIIRKLDAWRSVFESFAGVDVLYTDTDIWLFSDPVPPTIECVAAAPRADIVGQCDSKHSHESGPHRCRLCTGYIYMRCTPTLKGIVDWRKRYSREFLVDGGFGDQKYMNHHRKELCFHFLDHAAFENGVFDRNDCVSPTAILLHYNYMKGELKVRHMTARGHWLHTAA